MNYSIFILGATISISLFIRICCSLEGNFDQGEDLYSGTADEVYAKVLKHSLKSSNREQDPVKAEEQVEQLFNEIITTVNSYKQNAPVYTAPAYTNTKFSWTGRKNNGYNGDLCGNTKPPPGGTISPIIENEESSEQPDGCSVSADSKTMSCSSSSITSLPPLPVELESLHLNDTGIQNLSRHSFKDKTITNIVLFGNSKINYIHPWTFESVRGLKNLIILRNELKYLAYDIYVGLDDLNVLDLKYNQISLEIYKECPLLPIDQINTVLPNLRMLDMSSNPLKTIPRQMFAGLRNSTINTLYLENAYLQDIDEEAFGYLKNLGVLNLSRNPSRLVNPIEKLAKALEPLTSLFKLYLAELGLDDSHVQGLPTNIANQLRYLDMSKNKFHTIKREMFSRFPNLNELYLDDCSIVKIEQDAFLGNLNLAALSLRNNQIEQIPYFPLSIYSLNITNNQLLHYVSPLYIQNLTRLNQLTVSAINLTHLTQDMFVGLPLLEVLVIQNCGVTSVEEGTFQNLPSLRFLTLNDNPISNVSTGLFMGLENLETLNLRSINFTIDNLNDYSKSVGPFRQLSKIRHLNLEANKLETLPASLFDNLSNLRILQLASNPIESWRVPIFSYRDPTFASPLNESDLNLLDIELTNGNIQRVNEAMLEDFTKAYKIDLSNNNFICDPGACLLRDMINASLATYKQEFINAENYKCMHTASELPIPILDVTDPLCNSNGVIPVGPGPADQQTEKPHSPVQSLSSSFPATLVSVLASLTVVMSVVIILGYRHRAHLKYFWFSFKFNVIPASPRKAKLSTVEDNSPSGYDFDVFISYHHDDCQFIADVFLPEIEMEENEVVYDKNEFIEATNSVFIVEQYKIERRKDNNNDQRRFRVCLHERDFAAGVPITENIVDCVDRSRKTVIFVSNQYMESQWCSYELNLAYHRLVESRRKSFLLVLMEDIPVESRSKVLHYLMSSKTYLQWPGVNGADHEKELFWKRLRSFLQS